MVKNKYLLLNLVCISALVGLVVGVDECPNPETIKPCVCLTTVVHLGNEDITEYSIECGGNSELNLTGIFLNLSKELDPNYVLKIYQTFLLTNTRINSLPQNVFADIKFGIIRIENALNLTKINSLAFNGSNDEIGVLTIRNAPVQSSLPDNDIWAAIRSMHRLFNIEIQQTNLTQIPDEAFVNHPELFLIVMVRNNLLTSIGENVFRNIHDLEAIHLYGNKINSIADNAFAVDMESNKPLLLSLWSNQLNETNLNRKEIFANIQRPVNLDISSNKMSYLNETVFGDFLLQNPNNTIKFSNIDCNDCRNVWLIEKFHLTGKQSSECSNFSKLDDKKNFQNCK